MKLTLYCEPDKWRFSASSSWDVALDNAPSILHNLEMFTVVIITTIMVVAIMIILSSSGPLSRGLSWLVVYQAAIAAAAATHDDDVTGLIMQSGWLYIKQLLRQVVTGGPATSLPPRLLISTLVILITLTIITIITIAVIFLIFLNGHWTCMIRV